MRVGASSAAWIAASFTFVAFAVGFLMAVTAIPHDIGVGLVFVCAVLAALSAFGAYRAHYHPDLQSSRTPSGPSDASQPNIRALKPRARQAHRDATGRVHLGYGPASTKPGS